ncbi:MAG: hypothetical protein LM590_13535 [Thermofilum sp.]|nr:hypothetical protein [Thermofilum sp.]
MAKIALEIALERFLLENAERAKGERSELIYIWQGGRFRPLRYTHFIRVR